jgi:excisionase family DNA binding protein
MVACTERVLKVLLSHVILVTCACSGQRYDTGSVGERRVMEELFTVVEVSKRLKVPQRTVKRWLVSGQLRGLKVGRKWRVKPSAIEEFLEVSQDTGENARHT